MPTETTPYEVSFLTFSPGNYPATEMTEQSPGGGVVEYDEDDNEKPRWNCYSRLVFATSETEAERVYLLHLTENGIVLPGEHEICINDDVDHMYDPEENVAQRRPIGAVPDGLEW